MSLQLKLVRRLGCAVLATAVLEVLPLEAGKRLRLSGMRSVIECDRMGFVMTPCGEL
jgi:hypothetical protein